MGYEPTKEAEERDIFWNDLDRVVGIGCILAYLNGGIGDGVSRHNWCFWSSRRVVEFCVERGLCVGITYFEHRSLHKYARVARG